MQKLMLVLGGLMMMCGIFMLIIPFNPKLGFVLGLIGTPILVGGIFSYLNNNPPLSKGTFVMFLGGMAICSGLVLLEPIHSQWGIGLGILGSIILGCEIFISLGKDSEMPIDGSSDPLASQNQKLHNDINTVNNR